MPIQDRWDGRSLRDLHYPERAMAWYVRAANAGAFPVEKRPQYHGAAFIVNGIQFHYDRFMENRTIVQASGYDWDRGAHYACAHDAIAYISRLGQFFYFAKAHKLHESLERMNYLMPIRMKFTAHRSVDDPRKESPEELAQQAVAFGPSMRIANGDVEYQFAIGDGYVFFTPAVDHPFLMQEIFTVFASIYWPKSSRATGKS